MKAFGFLSFGHYTHDIGAPARPLGGGFRGVDARDMLTQAVELSEIADEIGVNGAYFRVHHFARQAAAPMPLLAAIAARTSRIEVGTGVIDLRYENPLYLAEEAAALDLLADGRVALGVSRGSPEPAERGWEAFGYTGSTDPRGADLGRPKFDEFLRAVRGEPMARAAGSGGGLRIEPHAPGLDRRLWWGAATRETAEWAATQGVNLMSSTLVTEADGRPFAELQHEQIERFHAAWAEAGHDWTPRTSVSRSVFPLVSDTDRALWSAREDSDQIGLIDGYTSTFGRTYAAEPDELVEQLKADPAVMAADTLMLTIPSHLGVEYNAHVLAGFAEHVAPALGWQPNTAGPVTGER